MGNGKVNWKQLLVDYARENSIRGACVCGRCIDAPDNPQEHQPKGHTADVFFFEVSPRNGASKEDLMKLVNPAWLDGKEHNYLEIGANLGDQGIALMIMGLGSSLGLWNLLTPMSIFNLSKDDPQCKQLAGMGMVSIKCISINCT